MEQILLAIQQKYTKFASGLGTAVGTETRITGTNWWYQKYQKGAIYCNSSNMSTFAVYGVIYMKYEKFQLYKGELGYPTTDETSTPDKVGRYNHFENGSIYWRPEKGAFEVHGDIKRKWASLNWERGELGYPISDETSTPDKIGRYNHFENGSIYWRPGKGAFEVHGAIKRKWAELSWERGYLGYPLTDECTTPDKVGRYNHFEGGSIYWTPTLGAHAVRKEIRDEWERRGWENGKLGYPVSDTTGTPTTTLKNDFQKGSISWSKSSGYAVIENNSPTPSGPVKKNTLTEKNVAGTLINKPFINQQVRNSPSNFKSPSPNNNTCIGYGYNALESGYICEKFVKWRNPILLLDEKNDISARNSPDSRIFVESGSTLSDMVKKTNTQLNVKGSYSIFSASVKTQYSTAIIESEEYVYSKMMGIYHRERLYFKYYFDANAYEYLNPEFKKDMDGTMSPSDLFEKYGTHLILDVYMGGRVETEFSTEKSIKETTQNINVQLKAGFAGIISGSGSYNMTKEQKEKWESSKATIHTVGGRVYSGISQLDFPKHHKPWVESLNSRENYDICDIPQDNNAFVPIWDLCTNQNRKKLLMSTFDSLNKNIENELLAEELYVVDIKIVRHKQKLNAINSLTKGYTLVEKDLNEGANKKTGNETDFIYLCYKLGHKSTDNIPFTNLLMEYSNKGLSLGVWNEFTHDNRTAKYYRFGTDLNAGSGSKYSYIYLNGTKDNKFGPIKRLSVITDSIANYPEWSVVKLKGSTSPGDCNYSVGGKYIYIIYKR